MKLDFPSSKGLFITATDTGVGKTMVTAALAYHLVQTGQSVAVFKPIATGCEEKNGRLISSDACFLAQFSNTGQTAEQITPVYYSQPLAPLVAASLSLRPIDWDAIVCAYKYLAENYDIVLVEGIGGINVPLESDYWVIDLLADMGLNALVVSRPDLGTINHTLLTIQACRSRQVPVAGIVLNHSEKSDNPLAVQTNPQILTQLSGEKILATITYDSSNNVENLCVGSKIHAAMALTDWQALCR